MMRIRSAPGVRRLAVVVVGAGMCASGLVAGAAIVSGVFGPESADIGAATPDRIPDLIEVVATNGRSGFVHRSQLDSLTGANVSSPEEAVAWERAMEDAEWATQEIPVYLLDGRTEVGVFEVSRSSATAVE